MPRRPSSDDWRALGPRRGPRPRRWRAPRSAWLLVLSLLAAGSCLAAGLAPAAPGTPATTSPPAVFIPASPADLRPLGNYASLEHLRSCLAERRRAGEDVSRAQAAVEDAVRQIERARRLSEAGDAAGAAAAAAQIRPRAELAYWMSYPSRPGELRGVWATYSAPGGWPAAMRTVADANLNAVFPYVCSGGRAWFQTDLLPVAEEGDCLAQAADAGRRSGVPVHARMLNLYAMCAPPGLKAELLKQGRLMLSASGEPTNWLCPTSPENRRLEVALAVEMATRYPVAGIQFDYLRYPGRGFCFCPRCRRAFQEQTGVRAADLPAAVTSGELRQRWLDWRRLQITSLVAEMAGAVRAARPGAAISAAVFINWEDHRDEFGQDWKDWVDRGLVDFVCPMDYTPSNERFTRYVQRQIGWVAGKVPLCPGIGVNADGMKFPGPQGLLDQVTISRNLKTSGWVIFNLDRNLVKNYLPFLKLGATSTPTAFLPLWRPLEPGGAG